MLRTWWGQVGADRCVVSLTQAVRVCLDAARSNVDPSNANSAEDETAEAVGKRAVARPFPAKAVGAGAG